MVTEERVDDDVLLQVKLPRKLMARVVALNMERAEKRAETIEFLLTLGLVQVTEKEE